MFIQCQHITGNGFLYKKVPGHTHTHTHVQKINIECVQKMKKDSLDSLFSDWDSFSFSLASCSMFKDLHFEWRRKLNANQQTALQKEFCQLMSECSSPILTENFRTRWEAWKLKKLTLEMNPWVSTSLCVVHPRQKKWDKMLKILFSFETGTLSWWISFDAYHW